MQIYFIAHERLPAAETNAVGSLAKIFLQSKRSSTELAGPGVSRDYGTILVVVV